MEGRRRRKVISNLLLCLKVLGHYATSGKVAGSISDEVIGFIN
jgi:hypothetical protein